MLRQGLLPLLDIGGGWGGVTQYCGARGVHVTSVESHDYELTMRNWAQRLEDAHDEIAARWGEELYRAFRIYLWGGAHTFRTNRLQAYHLVAERRADRGPRPHIPRRAVQFVASLR
jgi:cyclopropane-fatty-acyl-phospholipid synthase